MEQEATEGTGGHLLGGECNSALEWEPPEEPVKHRGSRETEPGLLRRGFVACYGDGAESTKDMAEDHGAELHVAAGLGLLRRGFVAWYGDGAESTKGNKKDHGAERHVAAGLGLLRRVSSPGTVTERVESTKGNTEDHGAKLHAWGA